MSINASTPASTSTSTTHADAILDAHGQGCATLTPVISARMRELAGGQVLEVRSDDPAARAGVPAWSRLTRNVLLAVVQEDSQRTRFYLCKKAT